MHLQVASEDLAESQATDGKPGVWPPPTQADTADNGRHFPACVPGGAGFTAPQCPHVLREPVTPCGSRREGT